MISINDNMSCSGCSACKNACPANAIVMKEDKEGFLYPFVDENKCIDCSLCDRVCPYHNKIETSPDLDMCFACYNNNENERSISSSGGIFVLLAKKVLSENGVVFGAVFDEQFTVIHSYAEKYDELLPLIGSKYMQSRIGDSFKMVKSFLDDKRQVLFAGTACQIAGLKGYLRKEYSNLICVDFICLGVPSPKVWKDYLNTFFEGEKIKTINFKNKNLGWHTFSLEIKTDKQHFCKNGRETYFFNGYFRQLYSRPSCSKCIFKEGDRVSDITISDCWGYSHIAPELDDNKGLSSVECHSQKGLAIFNNIKDSLVWKEAYLDDVKKYNSNYCVSAPLGSRRAPFWKDYDRISKEKLFKKYCSPKKESRIKKFFVIGQKRLRKLRE